MPSRFLRFLLFLAGACAQAQESVATLGMRHAAGSRLEWRIAEGSHPKLGPIRFATLKTPLATPVGKASLSSQVYFSCERNTTKIAIELANATAADDPGGLRPRVPPRLLCTRPASPRDRRLVQQELAARWEVSPIGDVLARGLAPAQLRECVALGIVQEVVLPRGWGRESARVEMELPPYGRELDSIFYTCGEASAHAAAPPRVAPSPPVASQPAAPVAQAPAAAPKPGPAPALPEARESAGWKPARTLARGRSNVRAAPTVSSAVVVELPPDVAVLVQETGGEWYRVKSPGRARFDGYIRRDRVVFP